MCPNLFYYVRLLWDISLIKVSRVDLLFISGNHDVINPFLSGKLELIKEHIDFFRENM